MTSWPAPGISAATFFALAFGFSLLSNTAMTGAPVYLPPPLPRPGVVVWFKVYAAVMCAIYLAVAAASLIFFLVDPVELEMERGAAMLVGAIMLVMGLGLFGAFVLPFFLPARPWVWVYDLVMICLGLTSACLIPFCIPLLIFWIKPATQRYFGKPG
jgi:hypothetical protein